MNIPESVKHKLFDEEWSTEKKRFVLFTRYSPVVSIPILLSVAYIVRDQMSMLIILLLIITVELVFSVKSQEIYDSLNDSQNAD